MHVREMGLMHLTNIAHAPCLYFKNELNKLKLNVQAPGGLVYPAGRRVVFPRAVVLPLLFSLALPDPRMSWT